MRPDNQLIDADNLDGSHSGDWQFVRRNLDSNATVERVITTIARIDPRKRQSDSICHRAA